MPFQSHPRIYRYIHVSDDGAAPCVDGGLVTLATCKPVIRSQARAGDWVMGFFPKPIDAGTVSWAARVLEVLDHGAYEIKHRGRRDAVYRQRPDGVMARLRPDYHPTQKQMDTDLSGPVLIFDPQATWYFGDKPAALPTSLMHLAASGQGHRVNDRRPNDLDALITWLKSENVPGLHGQPRHGATCAPCGGKRAPAKSKGC